MLEHHSFRYRHLHRQFRTTPLYHSMPKRQEPFSQSAFKLRKGLPKIQTSGRDLDLSSVNQHRMGPKISCQGQIRTNIYRSQPRQLWNATRLDLMQQLPLESCPFQAVTKQGKRNYNEDRYLAQPLIGPISHSKQRSRLYDLFAVFDGHGGSKCAQFLKENIPLLLTRSHQLQDKPEEALKQAFGKAEEKFLTLCQSRDKLQTSGSCAVVCLVTPNQVIVASLGDSRAILLSKDGFLLLTKDHKPEDRGEKMRILRHGGKIYREEAGMLNHIKIFRQARIAPGNLNVSRTIGDAQVKLKKYGGLPGMVSSEPDVAIFPVNNYTWLLLASDGLFEAFTCQQIHQKFKQAHDKMEMEAFADRLVGQAELKSSDNITVVVTSLAYRHIQSAHNCDY